TGQVSVTSPQSDRLVELLTAAGGSITSRNDGTLLVAGVDAPQVGEIAAANSIVLHELTPSRATLEAAFMETTRDGVEYHAGTPPLPPPPVAAETIRRVTEGNGTNDDR